MHAPIPPPRQDRSRRTLERILDATENLLREKPFEDITVAEVVRHAKSSVGSFYARFGSKEGLLPHLYQRYDRELTPRIDRQLRDVQRSNPSLSELAQWSVALFATIYRRQRWLFRALGLYSRTHPQATGGDLQKRRNALHRRIAETFAEHAAKIRHPDPIAAVELALFVVAAACREKILFEAPHARATKVSDRELKKELTSMLLAYLTAPDSGDT